MASLHRRPRLRVPSRAVLRTASAQDAAQDLIIEGYRPAQMIADLRKYQAELEIQNKALRYSQQEAEGASERFATLFSSVPLALMVVDEEGLVMASNAMALRLFQPQESDPPLNFLLPFVGPDHTDEVAVSFLSAKASGASEVSEVVFRSGTDGSFTGDLHIAGKRNRLINESRRHPRNEHRRRLPLEDEPIAPALATKRQPTLILRRRPEMCR